MKLTIAILAIFIIALPLITTARTIPPSGNPVFDNGNPVHDNGDPVRDDIAKINQQYGQAFVTGDSSLFLNSYSPDACILAANAPALCGNDGLLRFYKIARKTGVRNITFTTLDLFAQTKEYVTEQGTYEMFDSNAHSLGKGKYLVVWKKTNDGWRMYRDMFNSNQPPQPQS